MVCSWFKALTHCSGETRWEFCPYGIKGESIYSSVVFYRNKLFIGDRAGDFHCLDPATGASIWSQRATANGGDVNSTALGWEDLIFVGTNERTIVAFEEATGTVVWRKALDGPCTQELQRFQDCIAIATVSLMLFDPTTGEQVTSWSWPGERVWSMTVAGRNMLLNLSTKEEGSRKDRFVWTRNDHSPEEGWLGDGFPSNLRYDSLHDLIYASSFSALSVVLPGTREIKYRIRSENVIWCASRRG
jgi:PQQ-like domain